MRRSGWSSTATRSVPRSASCLRVCVCVLSLVLVSYWNKRLIGIEDQLYSNLTGYGLKRLNVSGISKIFNRFHKSCGIKIF